MEIHLITAFPTTKPEKTLILPHSQNKRLGRPIVAKLLLQSIGPSRYKNKFVQCISTLAQSINQSMIRLLSLIHLMTQLLLSDNIDNRKI